MHLRNMLIALFKSRHISGQTLDWISNCNPSQFIPLINLNLIVPFYIASLFNLLNLNKSRCESMGTVVMPIHPPDQMLYSLQTAQN